MALDTQTAPVTYDAPKKDLYELGEMPPMGHVPKQMYAWAIRRDPASPASICWTCGSLAPASWWAAAS